LSGASPQPEQAETWDSSSRTTAQSLGCSAAQRTDASPPLRKCRYLINTGWSIETSAIDSFIRTSVSIFKLRTIFKLCLALIISKDFDAVTYFQVQTSKNTITLVKYFGNWGEKN
jgi:hypothetical protein